VTIPAGATVHLSLAAVNRDTARFTDDPELLVDRAATGHFAFGHGLHHSLGAQLARIEGQEAIGMLVTRRPGLALAADPAELTNRRSVVIRGFGEPAGAARRLREGQRTPTHQIAGSATTP
jgi:vitamin D3 1,25-hydroxylase